MANRQRRRRKQLHRARRLDEEAWGAVDREDVAEAERLIRQAIAIRPDNCLLYNDLGLILWQQGQLREAEKAFRDGLQLRPDYEDAKMNLAALLADRGFLRQAHRLEVELASPGAPRAEYHRKKAEEYLAAAEERSRKLDA
jgi:Flp pilus assembly protein TadD